MIERFMRTLKEECLYVHRFPSLEEARAVIGAFIDSYNNEWLIGRHGYRTPAEALRELTLTAAWLGCPCVQVTGCYTVQSALRCLPLLFSLFSLLGVPCPVDAFETVQMGY